VRLLGLDHVGIVVRDIDETVARAGETVDGRAVGERFVSADIDLQVLLCGESTLELIEVRAAGLGMPKLKSPRPNHLWPLDLESVEAFDLRFS
jgi:methylmalonyl-CoA/ethylmalonyl-CoA epimerase